VNAPSKKIPENFIMPETYNPPKGKGFKRWLMILALFVFAFLWNYPFKKTLINQVELVIASQKSCPVSYDEIDLTFFMPGVDFKKPVISGICFQKPSESFPLKNLRLSFAGPNFSPLGIRFKLLAESENSRIEAYPAIGIGQQVIRIADSKIGEDLINSFSGLDLIQGSLNIDGLMEMAQNQIVSGKFRIQSTQLDTKMTNISGFNLPALDLGALSLLLELDAAGKMYIEKLTLGSNDSSIAANFKGQLTLNRYNILFSNADLNGEIRFSEELYQAIPIIKMLLQGKETTDGFYKLEIKGPLGQARPNFL
jgi:type II secretion system protein N